MGKKSRAAEEAVCRRKVRMYDLLAAELIAVSMSKHTGRKLEPYRCSVCGFLHLGERFPGDRGRKKVNPQAMKIVERMSRNNRLKLRESRRNQRERYE